MGILQELPGAVLTAQLCNQLTSTSSGPVWAMAADGNGNLFVGDINGNVINLTKDSLECKFYKDEENF